ncbi:hypothetical protein J19TS2_31130 [Cohnella xylanilytica]|uniref:hypothetical protein n=1 Tax=Cohnella xylanilytica TaxID=557555 RepID=UPI001B15DC53|nr:hypothetical protein [Cohnella xylanilytica]GIO13558.1 hypothetical protein J19TS2_31130 [Cohnella xylanilytica]
MKFTTTLEAVSSNKTKTTIKLSLSNAEARKFTAQYLNSIDKELIVTFDDPQMEMELRPAPNGRPGLVATVDSQGVVQSAERSEEPEDDHADLFPQEDGQGEQSHEESSEEVSFEESEESGEPEGDPEDPAAAEESSNEPESTAEPEEGDEAEVPQDELEAFILAEKPQFDDIPYDMPEVLRRRREENVKWMALSAEIGIPSTTLQKFFSVYKKRVKKMILASKGAA